jgi:hypothetical protein
MKQLSQFLETHREDTMRRFEMRLRRGHAPQDSTPSELRDGLPSYLSLLAEALKATLSHDPAAIKAVAAEHGGQRLRLGCLPRWDSKTADFPPHGIATGQSSATVAHG